jgi:LysM repeat protein
MPCPIGRKNVDKPAARGYDSTVKGENKPVNHIGLKLADGSFYPVLEEGVSGRKRLVLTTVRDNQDTVQIDLYRGEGARADQAEYIGTLSVENIQAAPSTEPDVELIVSTDGEGAVEASAVDLPGGQRKHLSLQLGPPGIDGSRELDLEGVGTSASVKHDTDEQLLTGETYPIGPEDRRKEHLHRRRRRPLLLVAFVVLALVLIAAIAFVVFRSLDGQRVPPLFGARARTEESVPEAGTAEPGEEGLSSLPEAAKGQSDAQQLAGQERAAGQGDSAASVPAVSADGGSGSAPAAVAPEGQKKNVVPTPTGGAWYDIKRGDTLWDIAATYYRNPWLYPRIARANKIANPDLIFAGSKLFIPEL